MTGMADGSLPITDAQFYFTMLLMMAGAFVFAFSVGAIGSIDEARMQKSEAAQLNINAMKRFLDRYPQLPGELIQSITDYYHYNLKQEEIGSLTTSAHMLEELPLALRCEAVHCLTRDALSRVSLFSQPEDGFMIALTQKMVMAVAIPNEVLTRHGIPVQCMYVVLRGQLEMLAPGGSNHVGGRVIQTLSGGSCFNEEALLTGEPPKVDVVAVSYSVLYQLRSPEFKLLEKEFVKTFDGFRQAARLQKKDLAKAAKKAGQKRLPLTREGEKSGTDDDRKSTIDRTAVHAQLGLRNFILLPRTRTRALWSFFLLFALCYDAVALPAKLAFVGNSLDGGLCALDVFADLVLFVDVWLRFFLAPLVDGQLVYDRLVIRRRYLRVSFIPNLLGSLPLSPLLLAWPAADARVLQAPRLLRVMRLLWRFFASDTETEAAKQQPSNLEELLRVFRGSRFDLQFAYKNLVPLLALYGTLAHYFACAYWWIVLSELSDDGSSWSADPLSPRTGEDSGAYGSDGDEVGYSEAAAGDNLSEWMPTQSLLAEPNLWPKYYRSLYFSVSTLTGLGKDLAPTSDNTILFTLCVFLVGVLVFAYITSAIVTVVNQADIAARQFQRRKIGLLGYMQDADIDEEIVKRAGHWLDHYWHAHGARRMERVLESLTPSLRHRVKKHIFEIVTASVPLFSLPRSDEDGRVFPPIPEQCLEDLVAGIVFEVFNADEWVLHKGMLSECFYIVASGSAEVILDEKEDLVVSCLRMGDCFGEHSALKGIKCSASVRAKDALELMSIPKTTLHEVVQSHPSFEERLDAIDHARQRENRFIMKWRLDEKQQDPASRNTSYGAKWDVFKPGTVATVAEKALTEDRRTRMGTPGPEARLLPASGPRDAAETPQHINFMEQLSQRMFGSETAASTPTQPNCASAASFPKNPVGLPRADSGSSGRIQDHLPDVTKARGDLDPVGA